MKLNKQEIERKCKICDQIQPIELYRLNKAKGLRILYCKFCEAIKDNERKRINRKTNKNYGHGIARQ